MCVERGLLSYDEKVSTYWPEFAAQGKGDATVAQLLSHQCGLYTVDGDISLAEAHSIMVAAESRLLEAFPSADIIIHPDPRGLAEKHGGLFAESLEG